MHDCLCRNSLEICKKHTELKHKFRKVVGYKITKQKIIILLYTGNEYGNQD